MIDGRSKAAIEYFLEFGDPVLDERLKGFKRENPDIDIETEWTKIGLY